MKHKKNSSFLSRVTIVASLLRHTWDFPESLSDMFSYSEILKVLKSKI